MATTFATIAIACLLLVLMSGSWKVLVVGFFALLIAWLAALVLGSFQRWPGER